MKKTRNASARIAASLQGPRPIETGIACWPVCLTGGRCCVTGHCFGSPDKQFRPDCLFISGSSTRLELFAGVFLFGGFALPLYSLCAAHANDNAEPGQFIDVVAGLTLAYGVGAMAGPFIASMVMEQFGPPRPFSSIPPHCICRWWCSFSRAS
jgi:hypothetical protein